MRAVYLVAQLASVLAAHDAPSLSRLPVHISKPKHINPRSSGESVDHYAPNHSSEAGAVVTSVAAAVSLIAPAKGAIIPDGKRKANAVCPWVELLPRVPATAVTCARVFRPLAPLFVDEVATFLVVSPDEARCGKLWAQRSAGPDCPDAPWPLPAEGATNTSSMRKLRRAHKETPQPIAPASPRATGSAAVSEAWFSEGEGTGVASSLLRPPAFFTLNLATPLSFAHAADMEPVGTSGDAYAFHLVPVESSPEANLTLRLDFAGCEGRDMLAMNPVDFAIFESPVTETKDLHWASPMDPSFKGCRSSPFAELAKWTGIPIRARTAAADATAAAAQGHSEGRRSGCDWSRLRGGWHLDLKGAPTVFSSPCRPRRPTPVTPPPNDAVIAASATEDVTMADASGLDRSSRGNGADVFQGAGNHNNLGNVCVIGDSNQKNWWIKVYLPVAYEFGLFNREEGRHVFLEGGGIEMDIAKYTLRFSTVDPSQNFIAVNQPYFSPDDDTRSIKGSNSGKKYSAREVLRTGQTKGLVGAVLTYDHNPWDGCTDDARQRASQATRDAQAAKNAKGLAWDTGSGGTPTDTVLFHAGSHNCGTSAVEAAHAVHLLVAMFRAWETKSNRSRRKCLVLVSTPDLRHELISAVGKGKFGDQAHFRNTFRIASANEASRKAVAEEQASHAARFPGERPLNVHFLDTFHLSLGLHWSGHDPAFEDPVHFRPEGLNREFASVLFEAATELCAS